MERDIHGVLWTGITQTDDSFEVIQEHETYQVIRKPRIKIVLDLIQKCNTCGKEMNNCIVDHIRREHPKVKVSYVDTMEAVN
jgi:hypothetical protein